MKKTLTVLFTHDTNVISVLSLDFFALPLLLSLFSYEVGSKRLILLYLNVCNTGKCDTKPSIEMCVELKCVAMVDEDK